MAANDKSNVVSLFPEKWKMSFSKDSLTVEISNHSRIRVKMSNSHECIESVLDIIDSQLLLNNLNDEFQPVKDD